MSARRDDPLVAIPSGQALLEGSMRVPPQAEKLGVREYDSGPKATVQVQ